MRRRPSRYRPKWKRSRHRLANGEAAHADLWAIGEHLREHFGGVDFVLHEETSRMVHVDVHVSRATPDRPFHFLATSGMSALAMNVPPTDCECCRNLDRAELVMGLPADWPVSAPTSKTRQYGWPIAWLRELARYPHRHRKWIGFGHTMASGDEKPYLPGTNYAGAMFVPPLFMPTSFDQLDTDLGRVHFLMPIPLFQAEIDYKLEHGSEALLTRLRSAAPTALGPLDPDRMPAVSSTSRSPDLRRLTVVTCDPSEPDPSPS